MRNPDGQKGRDATAKTSAYLTVYLALMVPVLLSLVLTLLQGVRISAVKMRTEVAADIAMNAVLSEYNRELLKQYDLLFVDMAYGTNHPDIANTQAHLKQYLRGNLDDGSTAIAGKDFLRVVLADAVIDQYSIASDSNGDVMRRQISDYYENTVLGAVDSVFHSGSDSDVNSYSVASQAYTTESTPEISWEDTQAEIEEILEQNSNIYDTAQEDTFENPADIANSTRSGGVLGLVLSNPSSISSAKVNVNEYLSHRTLRKGNGIPPEAEAISDGCSEVLFQKYVFEKLGSYRNEMDKSRLKYQIEYLIGGKSTDWDNLECVAGELLLIREGINTVYIFMDPAKVAEAEAWAAAMSTVIALPELLEPVKISLLLAWAYVESLQDVKILLEGGRVPAVKTAADWHTSLVDILNIRGSLRSIPSQVGMSYEDYLYTFLLAVGSKKKTYRTMDIMEMDIRQTAGNQYFCMDACFDSYQAKIEVESYFGAGADIQRRYGYYYAR